MKFLPIPLLLLALQATALDVVLHRSFSNKAPENTFASLQAALDSGIVDYIDTDVQVSADGVFYVMHDMTVNRTTNGEGMLYALSSQQIDQLDAGSWFDPKFANEHPPRLEEYMKRIKDAGKGIYIDLKMGDIKKVTDLVRAQGMEKRCFFWCWNDMMAKKFKEIAPDLALKVNASTPEEVRRVKAAYKCDIVETNVNKLTPEYIATCKELGLKVVIKTSRDDAEEYTQIIKSGVVDYVDNDDPILFDKVRKELTKN